MQPIKMMFKEKVYIVQLYSIKQPTCVFEEGKSALQNIYQNVYIYMVLALSDRIRSDFNVFLLAYEYVLSFYKYVLDTIKFILLAWELSHFFFAFFRKL